jgi:hypothetical protein
MSEEEPNSAAELEAMLAHLPMRARAGAACSIIGHSMMVRLDFGYAHCARCGELVGDALAGSFRCNDSVTYWSGDVQKCSKCEKNVELMTWKDTYALSSEQMDMLSRAGLQAHLRHLLPAPRSPEVSSGRGAPTRSEDEQ